MNNIEQIVENMEHPAIAELRNQMQVQKEDHEREVAELNETIEEKQGIIDDAQWYNDSFIDDVSRYFRDEEGKPKKLTVTELKEKVEKDIHVLHRQNEATQGDLGKFLLEDVLEKIEPEVIYKTEYVEKWKTAVEYIDVPKVLIWSNEHEGWWKPNKLGYTQNIKEAGQYEYKEAVKICNDANRYKKGLIPNETIMPVIHE